MESKMANIENNELPIFFCFTCVKNGLQYITKLFDSLIKQTKKNFIHYIYDDGSSKPMYDLINEYKQKVSKLPNPYKIIYEYNPINIGLNMATKHCINKVNLPYFIWINCDDSVDYSFFEEAEKYIQKYNNFSVYCSRLIFISKNKKHDPSKNMSVKFHLKQKDKYYSFIAGNMFFSYFFVNTKKYFEINTNNYFLNDERVFNDYQVMALFVSKNHKFGYIKKAISYQFLREDSECSKKFISNSFLASKLPQIIGDDNKKLINLKYEMAIFYDSFFYFFNNMNYKAALNTFLIRKNYIKKNKLPRKFFYLKNHCNLIWYFYITYLCLKKYLVLKILK